MKSHKTFRTRIARLGLSTLAATVAAIGFVGTTSGRANADSFFDVCYDVYNFEIIEVATLEPSGDATRSGGDLADRQANYGAGG